MREVRSPAGKSRLVVVQVGNEQDEFLLWYTVIEPGPVPRLLTSQPDAGIQPPYLWCASSRFCLHWGKPDPAFNSRFSILCTLDGKQTSLDGSLRNDDTVAFLRRSLPAVQPPPLLR